METVTLHFRCPFHRHGSTYRGACA
jgi:hypothetical protein